MLIQEINKILNLKSYSFRSNNFKKFKLKIIKKIYNEFNSLKKIYLLKNFYFFHPKVSFGNISSLNLLEIDELLIFMFYLKNSKTYEKFLDIGANIGVHSIINSKLGLKVEAYEPDPEHVKLMKKNIKKNKSKNIRIISAAVSDKNKKGLFVRVLGNTTGSHLLGAKKKVYNKIKNIHVKILNARKIIKTKNLVKIDAEGEEGKIINSLSKKILENNDFICEIGNKENAKIIFKKLKQLKINCFSQKNNFNKVKKISDMPETYKEGSLFISAKRLWNI